MPFGIEQLPLAALGAIFLTAASLVWAAGSRLSRYVDGISERTGLGRAFTGMLLLGGITSLPEVAAVSTSSALGNAPLAVNNLLGTASINLLLLAVADVVYGRDALTSVAARPATLMQGVLSMLLASAVALIATVGDVELWNVGFGTTILFLGCIAALWLSSGFENRHVWEAVGIDEGRGERDGEEPGLGQSWSLRKLVLATLAAAVVILMAGFALSITADAMAEKTGIADGMVGFVLVGASTSLPEISSITAAIRMRRYDMAVGDIYGTNLFNIALLFLADAIYSGEPVLAAAGRFEAIGATLAVLLTGIFIVGLLERRDRTIFRMGYDSLAAVLIFAGGVVGLARWG